MTSTSVNFLCEKVSPTSDSTHRVPYRSSNSYSSDRSNLPGHTRAREGSHMDPHEIIRPPELSQVAYADPPDPDMAGPRNVKCTELLSSLKGLIGPKFWFTVTLVLHLVLVASHVVLVWMRFRDGSHAFIFNDKLRAVSLPVDRLTAIITAVPQTLLSAYQIPLLYLTTTLAFGRDIHGGASVPKFCDRMESWTSPGSATMMFCHKSTRDRKIFLIAAYLVSSWGLSVTTPGLINADPLNPIQPRLAQRTSLLGQVQLEHIKAAFPVINQLPLLGISSASSKIPPLSQGVVYDYAHDRNSPISTSAIFFDVRCYVIPGLQHTHSGRSLSDDGSIQYSFQVHPKLLDIRVSPAARSLNIVSTQPKDAEDDKPLTLFVASTISIVDDYGGVNSTVEYSPGIVGGGILGIGSYSIQILGCNVHVINGTASIDTHGNARHHYTRRRDWSMWDLTKAPTSASEPLVGLSDFVALSPNSTSGRSFKQIQYLQNGLMGNFTPTMLEDYIMQWQGYYSPKTEEITLRHLERALECALALVYWRAGEEVYLRQAEVDQTTSLIMSPPILPQKFCITVNTYMPLVGTILTVIMTIMFACLALPRRGSSFIRKPALADVVVVMHETTQTTNLKGSVRSHCGPDGIHLPSPIEDRKKIRDFKVTMDPVRDGFGMKFDYDTLA